MKNKYWMMTLHTESWRSGFHRSWEHGGGYQRLMIVREREEWEGADQRVTVRTVEESWYALVHYRDSLSFCSFVVIKYLDKSNVRNKKYWFIAIGSQAYWEQDQSLEFSAVKEASGTESRPLCISLSLLLAVDMIWPSHLKQLFLWLPCGDGYTLELWTK